MSTIHKRRDLGHFQDLLLRACPPTVEKDGNLEVDEENGAKSIALLARWLGLTDWGVRLWIKKGKLPPMRAQEMVDLNPREVSLSDFSPYVYR